ncbi:MAG: TIGR00159 family protein [Spirochaetaceae bacterium]|nr:MAG: TIGR00159 family protein [Spirochaetaceae bacterium]
MNWLLNVWFLRDLLLPALDIIILAFIIYKGYQILVQTRAVQLVKGALFVALTYAVAFFLNLRTLLWILNTLAPSLVIGLAIIFQPELRKIFTRIGQGRLLEFSGGSRSFALDAVIKSVEALSYRRRGALIVFARSVGQKTVIESGTRIDGELTSELLLTIFAYDTALHDGAVVVEDGKVAAAGCFLPLSEQLDVRRSFGTRHRAALGLAEESDAVVLVVSEETGALSLAYEANLYYDMDIGEVQKKLIQLLQPVDSSGIQEEVVAFED